MRGSKEKGREKPEHVVADAGYRTPAIAKMLTNDDTEPYMPYKRPMTKKGYMSKHEYVYDEYYDCYICPNKKVLEYSTTDREGYREYKSDSKACKECPYIERCTRSRNKTKVVLRHIWEKHIEHVEDNRHTGKGKALYEKRKETIERVFADAKEKHGMRFTRHNGLAKVRTQVLLTFMVMNLKKLAGLVGGFPGKLHGFFLKCSIFVFFALHLAHCKVQ